LVERKGKHVNVSVSAEARRSQSVQRITNLRNHVQRKQRDRKLSIG